MNQAESPELPSQALVYKIFLPYQLAAFEQSGEFLGSPDDLRDGFIHLSFADQVSRSIEKHFSGTGDLSIAEFRASDLGPELRLDLSRGEQFFPHLYGPLKKEHLLRCFKLSEWGNRK